MYAKSFLSGFLTLGVLTGGCLYFQYATAMTITFDDLSDNGNGTAISNDYQGLNWTNWYVLNTPDFTANVGANGAAAGTTSPPNIAFNGNGDLAIFSSVTPFTLNSAEMTAFWNNSLKVTLTGFLNGTPTVLQTFTVSSATPMLETFDFNGFVTNEFEITTVGGTQNPNYLGAGAELAVDDLTITPSVVGVPEPSAMALLAAGLAGLGLVYRRHKTRQDSTASRTGSGTALS